MTWGRLLSAYKFYVYDQLVSIGPGRGEAPGFGGAGKQGSIILGIGGDNSDSAIGTFFESVMCAGNASDSADDAVQANIVAAGYGV